MTDITSDKTGLEETPHFEIVGTASTLEEEHQALQAIDSEEILKKVALAAISKLPLVGQVLGPLLGFLTADTKTVWEQVEEQVKALVNKRIQEEKVKTMRGIFDGLKQGFKNAKDYEGKTQYDSLLNLSYQMDTFRGMFQGINTEGEEWYGTLPYITCLALLDTLILSCLVKSGEEGNEPSEKNRQVNRQRFQDAKDNYTKYIKIAADETLKWRINQIETTAKSVIYYNPPYYGYDVKCTDKWLGKKVASGGAPLFSGKDRAKVYIQIDEYKDKIRKQTIDYLVETCIGPLKPWNVSPDPKTWNPESGSAWSSVIAAIIKKIIENSTKK
ncbi:MAG: hypothetical protein AAF518_27745 [Spirochaetota bacterium]